MAEEPQQQPSQPEGGTLRLTWPSLEVQWSDGTTEELRLGLGVTAFGRDSSQNDVVIPATYSSVSRRHFEIHGGRAGWKLVDLGSPNGVLVDGERVPEQGEVELSAGSEIRIGSPALDQEIRFQFQSDTSAQALAVEEDQPWTEAELAGERPSGPHLIIRRPGAPPRAAALAGPQNVIGRSAEADIRINAPFVSARHAQIEPSQRGFTLVDLNSTNGTWLNGERLTPEHPVPVGEGSIIRIGDQRLGNSIGLTFHHPQAGVEPPAGFMAGGEQELAQDSVLIGRAAECDIQLMTPTVSRRHALLEPSPGGFRIRDLGSTNGTFVNGERAAEAELDDGDVIAIQDHLLVFREGRLHQYDSQGMRVDAVDLRQRVKSRQGPLEILKGISLTIMPREFVALVGASGSGKSTLMNALMGVWPAEGSVELNGRDLYQNYDAFRTQIGYVPQADILHTSLTVDRALGYAARLRLPADVGPQERQERIDRALRTVELDDPALRDTRVGSLSGGQRKRVSIAAELLADPKLFFLDEATSGLDPGLEKKMMHTLRGLADEGRTVVLITHATANIVQVDQAAFLADGRLVYFGPPVEALTYFEVEEFADIYERVASDAEGWASEFQSNRAGMHSKYIEGRQETSASAALGRSMARVRTGVGTLLRQLGVMTRRTLDVLVSDRLTLLLLLLLFPLTAALQLIISSPDILTGNPSILGDPVTAARSLTESYNPLPDLNIFVFVMGLEAVLVGMYVPSNELIRERAVYLRERMVGLGVSPYLLSKVVVFMLFAALQCVLYLVVLSLGVDFPARGVWLPFSVEMFVTLFLTMMAGVGLGFMVSAISRSTDMAIYLLVILMFFEFFFAGTVFDLRDNPAEPLSYLTATRWSLLAAGVTIDMPAQAESTVLCNDLPGSSEPVCRHFPDATENLMLPYSDEALPQSWAILLAMTAVSVGLTGVMIRRLDPI